MELDQIDLVLVLAEELHFGRTAERLHVSQARVSKRVAAMERELGGPLFDRSSRHVRLTPLGQQFVERVGPAYRSLLETVDEIAHRAQTHVRVGFLPLTGGAAFGRLIRAFERQHPEITLRLTEVPYDDSFGALHAGDVDVLLWWRIQPESGITVGPVIDTQGRVAVMSAEHPLATRNSISVTEVDNWAQAVNVTPAAILTTFLPPSASDGTPISRTGVTYSNLAEYIALIARNKIAHATVTSFAEHANRDDLVVVPIRDLPPLDLVLYWRTAHENTAIRALAKTARKLRERRP
ncbi:LysR family transcriptional regulator [Flindersiella endophytica]